MVALVTPEEMVEMVVFLHGMQLGASVGYGGLVLPHHLQPAPASRLLHLDQDQPGCLKGNFQYTPTSGLVRIASKGVFSNISLLSAVYY